MRLAVKGERISNGINSLDKIFFIFLANHSVSYPCISSTSLLDATKPLPVNGPLIPIHTQLRQEMETRR